ncbi:hypothetical protein [Tsukamurella tyrosinosolvens]|uniref:hypothetical protein n=1 Tax=Tsukamurella tyrosinosolvens TaxID=57704 RepID=UPI002DD42D23|nr:hypothetical protein [Tsukamurella tyrosinosolvens]MEC4612907.1 hypothetical protein [Tsukamurella tyrosinosolvens]
MVLPIGKRVSPKLLIAAGVVVVLALFALSRCGGSSSDKSTPAEPAVQVSSGRLDGLQLCHGDQYGSNQRTWTVTAGIASRTQACFSDSGSKLELLMNQALPVIPARSQRTLVQVNSSWLVCSEPNDVTADSVPVQQLNCPAGAR